MNLVERFFRDLTEDAIREGSFTSVRELQTAIETYLAQRNLAPKARGKCVMTTPFHEHTALGEVPQSATASGNKKAALSRRLRFDGWRGSVLSLRRVRRFSELWFSHCLVFPCPSLSPTSAHVFERR